MFTKWFHLICGLYTWVAVGRLGPAAKLSPGSGVYGRAAGNYHDYRDNAWHFQSLDHHRTTRPILHHTPTGDTLQSLYVQEDVKMLQLYFLCAYPNTVTFKIRSTWTSLKWIFLSSSPLVIYQVYQWSAPRNPRRLETNICRNFTEPAGSQQPANVEAFAVQCGFSPHCCAGTSHL